MALSWSEDLAVGVDMIDNQHKEIFKRVNNLLSAMGQGKGKEEVGKVIVFLADYVVKHFQAEEELMTKHNYDGYSQQKDEHTRFIKDFSGLKKEFNDRGVTSQLTIQTQQKVCNWLTSHIGNVDKKFGAFLKTKK